jgi:hypothetical protein
LSYLALFAAMRATLKDTASSKLAVLHDSLGIGLHAVVLELRCTVLTGMDIVHLVFLTPNVD